MSDQDFKSADDLCTCTPLREEAGEVHSADCALFSLPELTIADISRMTPRELLPYAVDGPPDPPGFEPSPEGHGQSWESFKAQREQAKRMERPEDY